MEWMQAAILAVLVIMAVIAVVNVVTFRRIRGAAPGILQPMVSVLIPARNEEKTIGSVLASVAGQEYPHCEVLVLDDNSQDATARLAGTWASASPHIRLLNGKPLPEGWGGKTFACFQLAAEARGEYLLFTDADTVHAPQSIAAAIAVMQDTGAGLLTLIPDERMDTFWENVVLPLLHFTTFCFLPMPLVTASRQPSLAMANGQFMLFRRDVYDAIGGHAAVRGDLVEDVWLSRRVKRAGFRLMVCDGRELVSCRMYTSLSAIWEGFSKNLFPGFEYSVGNIGAMMVFSLLTSVMPFLVVPVGIAAGATASAFFRLACWQAGIVLGIRLLLALRFRLALWPVLLHPLAMLVFIAIAFNSMRSNVIGQGARWKGRVYDFRHRASGG